MTDIQETVRSLVQGASLSTVPIEQHPILLMPLSAARNEAIVAGNQQAVKRIQHLMKSLVLIDDPQKKRPRKTPQKAREAPEDDLITEVLEGRPLNTIEIQQIPSLIKTLKQKKENATKEGDYRLCQRIEDIIQEINKKKSENSFSFERTERVNTVQQQIEDAKAELSQIEQFFKNSLKELKDKREGERVQMIDQLKQQLKEYDASFPDVLPASYRKLSPAVLQLREQEKHMVLSNRYNEALEIREKADALEKEELQQQKQRFNAAFKAQREVLIETQMNQIAVFNRNWDRRFLRLEQNKQQEMMPVELCISNLKRKLQDMDGLPRLNNNWKSQSQPVSRLGGATRNRMRSRPALSK